MAHDFELQEGVTIPPPVLSEVAIVLMNFTQFGINFMAFLLVVVVVPVQIGELVGGYAKGSSLGGLVAGGAVVMLLVSPLVGMVSDRIRSRMGKRRPVMAVGTLLMCIGLLGMAFSSPQMITDHVHKDTPNPLKGADKCNRDLVAKRCLLLPNVTSLSHDFRLTGSAQLGRLALPREQESPKSEKPMEDNKPGNTGLYTVFFLLVISSQTAVSISFNALVADKSHPSQRGLNSGVMGALTLLGNVAGAVAGLSFTHMGILTTYCIIIFVVSGSIAVTVFVTKEASARDDTERKPLSCRDIFVGFWSSLKEHDFRWVFITRFLMQQGVATITGFLEFWVDDMVQLPYCWSAATSVAFMMMPLLLSAAASSIVFGIISDRTGSRKAIVIGAAFLMGAGSLANAFVAGSAAYYIALMTAFIIGIGFGAFQSVDFALVMDVLPEESEKAKDIAVWHQALVLPQALATPIGGFILDVFERVNCKIGLGYIILFIVASFYFVLSGVFIVKIRRAK